MGLAKAKTSAGQKAMDLTKHLKKLQEIPFDDLMKANTRVLKKMGLSPQERKRILAHTDKVRLGWTPPPGGKGWRHWARPTSGPHMISPESDPLAAERRKLL